MDLFEVRNKLSTGISIDKIKLRVTSYSRVSTDHEEQKKSLVNQQEHFEEMIKNNSNWIYVDGYVDEGISGTSDKKRVNFKRMIRDARDGLFDLVITKEISRFSRNTLDSIKYTRELLQYGVAVYFVNDNINTILTDSELRLTIMASLAQDEVRRLSERVKFGMMQSIKKEVILGNNSLLGYEKDKITGNLLINQEEAEIVKRIYKMYVVDNLSLNKIANTLNKENNLRIWKAIGIERIIANPKYMGYFCGKKTEVVDYITKKVKIIPKNEWIVYTKSKKIPVIINEELWELANKRLTSRKRNRKNNQSYQNNYLFTGKIFCLNDQMNFQRRRQCKVNDEVTWLCANYLKNGKNACHSPNIRESELLIILEQIINYLEINKVTEILVKTYDILMRRHQDNCQKFIKRKRNNEKKLNKLMGLYLEEHISKEEYLRRREKYLNEVNAIKVDNQNEKHQLITDKIKNLLETMEIKKKIMALILKKMEVKQNNDKIYLKINLEFDDEILKKIKKTFDESVFSFKRGFNSVSTKRYIVNYQIFLDN